MTPASLLFRLSLSDSSEKIRFSRSTFYEELGGQCSQPSSPSVFGGGRDGLWLVVRLFGGARTDYAREGKDRTDYRGL